jgi:hypothetical protein
MSGTDQEIDDVTVSRIPGNALALVKSRRQTGGTLPVRPVVLRVVYQPPVGEG